MAAARQSDHPDSAQALEALCRAYWQPVYRFIRRSVTNPDDARDLTQGFFEHLLENRTLGRADADKGRFRSFLLGAVKYFLADQRDHRAALKRGGQIEFLQFDSVIAESWASGSLSSSAETQYDRDWALAVLHRVLLRLREEFILAGREPVFETLKCCLTGEKSADTYASLALKLNMTEGAVKMNVKRMRDRFAALVRQEISQTVANAEDLEAELRVFVGALIAKGSL